MFLIISEIYLFLFRIRNALRSPRPSLPTQGKGGSLLFVGVPFSGERRRGGSLPSLFPLWRPVVPAGRDGVVFPSLVFACPLPLAVGGGSRGEKAFFHGKLFRGKDGWSRAPSRSPSFQAIRGPPCSDCSCMIDAVLPDLSVSKHVVLYGFVNLRTAMMLWTFLSPLLSNFLLSLGWLTT